MSKTLIAGIGNILLSDDGVGPWVAQQLARHLHCADVQIEDLGAIGSELIDYLSGRDRVILVDSVASAQEPGTILRFDKSQLLAANAPIHFGQHTSSLISSIQIMEIAGVTPRELELFGIVGASYAAGIGLSHSVRISAQQVISEITESLCRSCISFTADCSGALSCL
jgi:hydrogenase maturation protease